MHSINTLMNYQILETPAIPKNILQSVQNTIDQFDKKNHKLTGMDDLPIFETFGNTKNVIDEYHVANNNEELGLPLNLLNSYYDDLCTLSFLKVEDIVTNWVHKNITPTGFVGINIFHGGTHFFPHLDLMRNRAINYIYDAGGETVETCFWKAKENFQHLQKSARTFFPYDRLELINKVVLKQGQWCEMDVSNIHNVMNIEKDKRRITITVSLETYNE